jgi:hypothetical protein
METPAEMLRKAREAKLAPAKHIEPLELNVDGWLTIHLNEQAAVLSKARSLTGITSPEDLQTRLLTYVHIYSMKRELPSLMELNRHFLRVATDLKVKISDIVDELIADGLITRLNMGKVYLYISTSHWNLVQERIQDPLELEKLKRNWFGVPKY